MDYMSEVKFFQVDAFTSEPFTGNPAGICFMPTDYDDELYLKIAVEMNLSETAFLHPISPCTYTLRWFTPVMEVPLCGHATLAAAHVLFNHVDGTLGKVNFKTLSGDLYAYRAGEGVLMDFPRNDSESVSPPIELFEAMGVDSWDTVQYSYSNEKLLVHVKNEETVNGLQPDYGKMLEAPNPLGWFGVIVTAKAEEYDFVSRYFAPWRGINEDPVTGSAHTVLAPYWSEVLGKSVMKAYQASRRGGELVVKLVGDRVQIKGESTTVITGVLHI